MIKEGMEGKEGERWWKAETEEDREREKEIYIEIEREAWKDDWKDADREEGGKEGGRGRSCRGQMCKHLYSCMNWSIVERTQMPKLRNGSKGDSNYN